MADFLHQEDSGCLLARIMLVVLDPPAEVTDQMGQIQGMVTMMTRVCSIFWGWRSWDSSAWWMAQLPGNLKTSPQYQKMKTVSSQWHMLVGWQTTDRSWNGKGSARMRRNTSPMKAVKHWNRLPETAVPSPALGTFKAWLEKALSKLVWPLNCFCFGQEVGLEISSSLNNYSMALWILWPSSGEWLL